MEYSDFNGNDFNPYKEFDDEDKYTTTFREDLTVASSSIDCDGTYEIDGIKLTYYFDCVEDFWGTASYNVKSLTEKNIDLSRCFWG